MSGFGFDKQPKGQIDKKILDVYERLRKVLTEHRKITATPSRQKWINELTKATKGGRSFDPISIDTILECVAYLEKNIGKPTCPHVFSASSFIQKIKQIKRLADNSYSASAEEVNPHAMTIYNSIEHYGWPLDVRTKLPAFIDKQLRYVAQLKVSIDQLKGSDKDGRAFAHLSRSIGVPVNFVECWMKEAWFDIINWDAWSGQLSVIECKRDSPRFDNWLRQQLVEYGLPTNVIERILSRI